MNELVARARDEDARDDAHGEEHHGEEEGRATLELVLGVAHKEEGDRPKAESSCGTGVGTIGVNAGREGVSGGSVARTESDDPHDEKQYRVAHTLLERGRAPIRILGTRSMLGKPVAAVVRPRDEGKDD
eukprot:scaffold116691_cov64-Phaeocystis_antarctica.AAC.2